MIQAALEEELENSKEVEKLQQDNYSKLQFDVEVKEKIWRSKEQSLLNEVDRLGGDLEVALRKVRLPMKLLTL